MAYKKSTLPIPPFPGQTNRHYFAVWLSGFTDGEGCFSLTFVKSKTQRQTPQGYFGGRRLPAGCVATTMLTSRIALSRKGDSRARR